jgi:hypothetical protein
MLSCKGLLSISRSNQGVDDEAHWLLKCRALLHIRKKHNTLLRNRHSVDKLMSAMYDRNLANDLVELHMGYYGVCEGPSTGQQCLILSSRPVTK